MLFFKRLFSFFLAMFVTLTTFPFKTLSQRAEDFRLTAYVTSNSMDWIDPSHFVDLTDVIFFGAANFNTEGEIVLSGDFDRLIGKLRDAMKDSDANLYLNIIGPGYRTKSTDWNEQMDDQGNYHDMAFRSGKLEGNIKAVLDKYGFDGIFFDYEYPLTKAHWKVFDKFLISLDSYLGDAYKIGCAISAWNNGQSRKAIKVVDMVEVMAYDTWEKDGTHASLRDAKSCIRKMLFSGYKRQQLDLGIPFYARPTTQEAYWYGYSGYYDKIDENGFTYDPETGLTFSFNTYDMVYEKTDWAIRKGLGGAMVWHYACDVPKSNDASLFNAMVNAKNDIAEKGLVF